MEAAELRRASTQLADVDLLNAVLAVLQDASRPIFTRRAALEVVVAHYAPYYTVSNYTWNEPESSGLGMLTDTYQIPGAHPVTDLDRTRIVSILAAMGTSEPDARLRAVARAIAAELIP